MIYLDFTQQSLIFYETSYFLQCNIITKNIEIYLHETRILNLVLVKTFLKICTKTY